MLWLSVKFQQPFQWCHVFQKGRICDVTIACDFMRGDTWEYILCRNSAHFTNMEYLQWKRQWYKIGNNLFNPLYTNHNYGENLINQIINPYKRLHAWW